MRLGKFEVVRHLGAGGMSTVWLARGPVPATFTAPASSSGLVVLKQQLRPDDDDGLREEGRVGMQLRHPGVVQTLGCFDDDTGRPVLALEYVAGVPLAQLRRRGPLPAPAVCRVGADIAEALGALHDVGVLHRDVTPTNVIVSHDGSARLIDLGIARSHESEGKVERTVTGSVRGTLRYLAPELFDGAPHSPATDLWALGVCLFELSLGRAAVTGPEAVQLGAVVRGHLLSLQPSERLEPIVADSVARLCNRDRAQRFAHARDAARVLAAGDRGDGAMLASVAVYAAADQPRTTSSSIRASASVSASGAADAVPRARGERLVPAGGEDGFARMAASTYCGQDDDPFSDAVQASTIITPTAHQDRLVPAPVTIIADEHAEDSATSAHDSVRRPAPALISDDIEASPTAPGTPGGMRKGAGTASANDWDLPQPITGEADADAARAPVTAMSALPSSTDPLRPAASPHTAPSGGKLPSIDDGPAISQLLEPREPALGAPSIIAIVVIVATLVLSMLIALSR